jgi:hypothetical protein
MIIVKWMMKIIDGEWSRFSIKLSKNDQDLSWDEWSKFFIIFICVDTVDEWSRFIEDEWFKLLKMNNQYHP